MTWDVAAASPVTAGVQPQSTGRSELAIGFFGAVMSVPPPPSEYMRAMAMLGDDPVPTSSVADELGRKPSASHRPATG